MISGDQRRRHAIGFRKDDVKADYGSLGVAQRAHQFRHPRAWPRPLAVGGDTIFIDIDDRDWRRFELARAKDLKAIKQAQAHYLDGQWVPDA